MNFEYLIIILLVLIVSGQCASSLDEFPGNCNPFFSCGNISGFGYPFRRHQDPAYCGYSGFELNCDEQNPPTINIMNMTYQVLSVDPTAQILRIVREDMIDTTCPQDQVNTTINHELFDYTSGYKNISLFFGCADSFNMVGMIGLTFCDNNGVNPVFLMPGIQGPGTCKTSVIVPVPVGFMNPTEWVYVAHQGFEVRWKVGVVQAKSCTDCTQSGGQCLYGAPPEFACACPGSSLRADVCTMANKTPVNESPSSGI